MLELDILIAHSSTLAINASSDSDSKTPFLENSPQASYNSAYAYFLETCKKFGLKAVFTSSEDIVSAGTTKSYWDFKNDKWLKIKKKARAKYIFDNIAPISEKKLIERQLLVTDKEIYQFNDHQLYYTFFDKFKAYKKLNSYLIPTVAVASNDKKDVELAVENLKNIINESDHPKDFSTELILKDRFGIGKSSVFIIKDSFVKKIKSIMDQSINRQFVLEASLKFNKGFTYKKKIKINNFGLVFHHNKLIHIYLEVAQKENFNGSDCQKAELIYIKKSELPSKINKMAAGIVEDLDSEKSLYTLNFTISNLGNIYLRNGDFTPGIDWDSNKKINERKSKQLIEIIVKEFALRIKEFASRIKEEK